MNFRWLDVVDILLVAFLIYRSSFHPRNPGRSDAVRPGHIISGLSRLQGQQSVHPAVDAGCFLSSLVLVIVVLFQNDIRRALIHVGKNPFFTDAAHPQDTEIIEEIVKGCVTLASRRIGALIRHRTGNGVARYARNRRRDRRQGGRRPDHIHLLPYSPIHDGAVVIQQGRLKRAGCFLPLSQNPDISKSLGTRHRAAIGLPNWFDAVVVVVSEETGKISVVVGGKITRDLDSSTLRRLLKRLLEQKK